MGLGKAQKQKRNIEVKIAKREAAEKARIEWIKGLENDRVYLVDLCNIKTRLLGREIKAMNSIEVIEDPKQKPVKLSLKQKVGLKLQTISLALEYFWDQVKELYKIKRNDSNITVKRP